MKIWPSFKTKLQDERNERNRLVGSHIFEIIKQKTFGTKCYWNRTACSQMSTWLIRWAAGVFWPPGSSAALTHILQKKQNPGYLKRWSNTGDPHMKIRRKTVGKWNPETEEKRPVLSFRCKQDWNTMYFSRQVTQIIVLSSWCIEQVYTIQYNKLTDSTGYNKPLDKFIRDFVQ